MSNPYRHMIHRKDGKGVVTFRTGMQMLHWCIEQDVFERHSVRRGPGKVRPNDIHLSVRRSAPEQSFAYHVVAASCPWNITYGHVEAMTVAQVRYVRLVHYLREVEPAWRPDTGASPSGEVHCADNSIELHEINKYGKRRRRMVVQPHGDIC